MNMKKIDLHVHSKFSEHPSEWFLQRLGAAESYTEPETIYRLAKERGMDYVTITDHNKIEGALLLKEKYPNDVIVGLETTAYFPEDGCKVHILLFGIDEKKFKEIEKLRENIYDLRDWIKKEKIAYSVSHPTYSVNGKLNLEHLEKLILLFDVFEGLNGGRNAIHNNTWVKILKEINSDIIESLYNKFKIEPISENPWLKSFTGGSDDHAGVFIGKTYTIVDGKNIDEVIENIVKKKVSFDGEHNDFKSLSFSVFKVAYDFSKTKTTNKANNLLIASIIEHISTRKTFSFFDQLKLKIKKNKKEQMSNFLFHLIENLRKKNNGDVKEKLNVFYKDISDIADTFIKLMFSSFEKDLKEGNFINLIKTLTSSVTGIFLSIPFFSSFKHLNQDRFLLNKFVQKYANNSLQEKSILWFTDTIDDLNGVSVTLKELLRQSIKRNKNLHIVSSVNYSSENILPKNFINLPFVYEFNLPYYEQYILRIPSVLKSLEILQNYQPDKIYVSTPGPVGLFGLLMSKIFNVENTAVFHTDFTAQAKKIVEDESLINLLDAYIKWFYSCFDTIEVPSKEYIKLLEEKGIDGAKLKIFKRGIDLELFSPQPEKGKNLIKNMFNLNDGIILLYTGRISKDKNLKFLIEIYRELVKNRNHLNLLIVGDGPYINEMKEEAKSLPNVYFTGKVKYDLLPYIYSASDLFIFPSTTDTFGMVVLEAQACGLPAVVSDKGGPKEIIIDGITGFVAKSDNREEWIRIISFLLKLIETNSPFYKSLKENARKNVEEKYRWDVVINDLFSF